MGEWNVLCVLRFGALVAISVVGGSWSRQGRRESSSGHGFIDFGGSTLSAATRHYRQRQPADRKSVGQTIVRRRIRSRAWSVHHPFPGSQAIAERLGGIHHPFVRFHEDQAGAGWLSATDDRASASSRPMDDPEVRTVAIDAETPWLCRDVVHLETAKPAFQSTCYKTWTVAVPTPADRAAAAKTIELVEKSCVAAKR